MHMYCGPRGRTMPNAAPTAASRRYRKALAWPMGVAGSPNQAMQAQSFGLSCVHPYLVNKSCIVSRSQSARGLWLPRRLPQMDPANSSCSLTRLKS